MKRRSFLKGAASLLALPALAKPEELKCDVAVICGGVGGFVAGAAAFCNRATGVVYGEAKLVSGSTTPPTRPPAGDRVSIVSVADLRPGSSRVITAQYFLDATELGELLPLTKTEFVTGAEAQSQTNEMHAVPTAQPANSQSFTFCFAIDYLEGE